MQPVLFLGHGNPMHTLSRNAYVDAWRALGHALPRPAAVLCVSAHWYVPATAVTTGGTPRTIHDFGGFPEELFRVQYPAQGKPELAHRVAGLLAPADVGRDAQRGLDHGAWTVLRHLFPEADVPVVQLSIDASRPPRFHYDLGRRLAALRRENILIVGSGNLVHNLSQYAWDEPAPQPFDWAVRAENLVRKLLASGDDEKLIDYEKLGRDAAVAIPTPEHYLPFLYVLGARQSGEPIAFPVEGIDGGTMSMLGVRFG